MMIDDLPRFRPCGDHQSLLRMPEFERALGIARECPECEVQEAS